MLLLTRYCDQWSDAHPAHGKGERRTDGLHGFTDLVGLMSGYQRTELAPPTFLRGWIHYLSASESTVKHMMEVVGLLGLQVTRPTHRCRSKSTYKYTDAHT